MLSSFLLGVLDKITLETTGSFRPLRMSYHSLPRSLLLNYSGLLHVSQTHRFLTGHSQVPSIPSPSTSPHLMQDSALMRLPLPPHHQLSALGTCFIVLHLTCMCLELCSCMLSVTTNRMEAQGVWGPSPFTALSPGHP